MNIDHLIVSMENKAFVYQLNDCIYKLDHFIYEPDIDPIRIRASVFFVKGNTKWFIIDTGAYAENFKKYMVPAAEKMNMNFDDVAGILITHSHWDHLGGLIPLMERCQNAFVYGYAPQIESVLSDRYIKLTNQTVIDGFIRVVPILGHSDDSVGFIDTRTNTVFTGDAIQLYGTPNAGMFVFDGIKNYISHLKMLKSMELENLFATHLYCPLGACAIGREQVTQYIDQAIFCIEELITFTAKKLSDGITSVEAIKKAFIAENQKRYTDFPFAGFDFAIFSIIKEYRLL